MLGHTGEVIEDPLVAAMGRASADHPGDRPGWKSVIPSDADGADFDGPLWVRRLDAKMPVLPAAALGERVGRVRPDTREDTDAAATQSAS